MAKQKNSLAELKRQLANTLTEIQREEDQQNRFVASRRCSNTISTLVVLDIAFGNNLEFLYSQQKELEKKIAQKEKKQQRALAVAS